MCIQKRWDSVLGCSYCKLLKLEDLRVKSSLVLKLFNCIFNEIFQLCTFIHSCLSNSSTLTEWKESVVLEGCCTDYRCEQ